MPIIDGVKYACDSCIKGHRTSKCSHHDRPLTQVKKKGRPFSSTRSEGSTQPANGGEQVRSDTPPELHSRSPSSALEGTSQRSNSRPPKRIKSESLSDPLAVDVGVQAFPPQLAGNFGASWPQQRHMSTTSSMPGQHTPPVYAPHLPSNSNGSSATKTALFVPSTEGTSSCFCGDSCACPGCPLHDPLLLKRQVVRSPKPPCQCTVVEKMISGQDAQCCSDASDTSPSSSCHTHAASTNGHDRVPRHNTQYSNTHPLTNENARIAH